MNRSKFDKKEGSETNDVGRLRHSVWECKYHLVWIPKCRRKVLYGQLRRELGEVFHELARQKECRIEEGHLLADHVHVLMSIPPKYAVAQVVGFVKGKSAIHIARSIGRRRRNFIGESFWARGYYVSTAGKDEEAVRKYIKEQEAADHQWDHPLPGALLPDVLRVRRRGQDLESRRAHGVPRLAAPPPDGCAAIITPPAHIHPACARPAASTPAAIVATACRTCG